MRSGKILCVVLAFSLPALSGCGGGSSSGGGTDPDRDAAECLSFGATNDNEFPISNSCDKTIRVNTSLSQERVVELAGGEEDVYRVPAARGPIGKTAYVSACFAPYTPDYVVLGNYACR